MPLLFDRYRVTGARFHFGRHGLGQEETAIAMSSDSLFSAILARLAEQLTPQKFKDFLAPFEGEQPDPPFVLTSTFPYVAETALFPAIREAGKTDDAPRPNHKKIENIRFITEPLFRELLAGKPLRAFYPQTEADKSELLAQGETVLCQAGDGLGSRIFWAAGEHAHVTIDRASNNPALFFTGEVSFGAGCGLWFGVHWLKDETPWRPALKLAIEELQITGLGGERNNGFGKCEIKPWETLELPEAQPKGYWTNLSRFLPCRGEVQALIQGRSYTVEAVGGWLGSAVSSGQRRKTINMLSEGAVLKHVDSTNVYGFMPDLQPEYEERNSEKKFVHPHPVFRAGFAVPVGIKEAAA